tara:strand:+ start:111 stop:599 length:489 start_codon:yes stop_codon:yes gene_type:complete
MLLSVTMVMGQPEQAVVKEKKEKMEMMMAWKLTEHLKLTNEEAEKFFPRFREHRETMDAFTDKEKKLNAEIKEKIERGDALSNNDLDKLLDELSGLERKRIKEKKSFIDGLEGHLDNVQRAKLIGFEHRFRKDVREQLKHHKKGDKKRDRPQFDKKGNHFWK